MGRPAKREPVARGRKGGRPKERIGGVVLKVLVKQGKIGIHLLKGTSGPKRELGL